MKIGKYIYKIIMIMTTLCLFSATVLADWHTEPFGGEVTVEPTIWSNSPPVNSNPFPTNDSTGVSLSTAIHVDVEDLDVSNQSINTTFRTNASGSWVTIDYDETLVNATLNCFNTTFITEYSHKYWWSTNTTDNASTSAWDNDTYCFTTSTSPINSNPAPTNTATGQSFNPRLYINVTDPDGDQMSVTFLTNTSGSWQTIGTNYSCANGTYSQQPSNMNNYNTKYWWMVNTTDGVDTDSDTYYFTTLSSPANWYSSSFGGSVTVEVPVSISITNEDPQNGAIKTSLNPQLNAQFNNSNGHNMNVYFRTNAGGTWTDITSYMSVGNGTRTATPTNMDSYSTMYYWSANASDVVTGIWKNETYYFTTAFDDKVEYYYVLPVNGSIDASVTPTLQVMPVIEEGGVNVDLYFYSNASGSWQQLCSYENTGAGINRTCTNTNDMNQVDTTYYWSANASRTDSVNWSNQTFHFTTAETPATWYSSSFGGSVTVEAPPAWGNWSAYWCIGQTSTSDLDLDMDVDATDVAILKLVYSTTGTPGWIYADINNDGKVDYIDAAILALLYGDDYT